MLDKFSSWLLKCSSDFCCLAFSSYFTYSTFLWAINEQKFEDFVFLCWYGCEICHEIRIHFYWKGLKKVWIKLNETWFNTIPSGGTIFDKKMCFPPQPFWPMGTGIARGFLAAMDSGWMVKSWAQGKTPLEVLAERCAMWNTHEPSVTLLLHSDLHTDPQPVTHTPNPSDTCFYLWVLF